MVSDAGSMMYHADRMPDVWMNNLCRLRKVLGLTNVIDIVGRIFGD